MEHINLAANSISSEAASAITDYNISQKLQIVDLASNKLSSMPELLLEACCASIVVLNCSNNQITDITNSTQLFYCTRLRKLDLSSNRINLIPVSNVISAFKQLQYFSIVENPIQNIPKQLIPPEVSVCINAVQLNS